jgi:cobalamin synthase
MQNIHEWGQKIKILADDAIGEWGLVAVVFLVGLASFGLGRLSALEDAKPPVAITEAPTASKPSALFMGGLVVASRSGSAYYYPWCTGATKILPANQVWFVSESAARAAGYTPAKACAGLGN